MKARERVWVGQCLAKEQEFTPQDFSVRVWL